MLYEPGRTIFMAKERQLARGRGGQENIALVSYPALICLFSISHSPTGNDGSAAR